MRLVSAALLLSAVAALFPLRGQVTVTEFLAANARGLADEDRDYPDWIELYNAGSTTVNLADWALTDDPAVPAKWRFPSTNLPPNRYLVVFASGKNRAVSGAALHTSFSLNADGEYLALRTPEGELATELAPEFPRQAVDVSYGFKLGRWLYFATPTPGAANGSGFNDFVADTKFSHDRGFYDAPFDLVITCATPGATLIYATNGIPPSPTNGTVVTGPIRIAGTTVLRAAAFKEGWQPSNTDTQSYLFLEDVIRQSPTGQPPPGWPSSWGSNTRDYGMDPDVVNDPRYRDTIKDDLKTLPSFSVVMNLQDLFHPSTGIYANPGQDGVAWERPCSIELVHPSGAKGFQIDGGIRIRGGFSRSTGNPKHAFRFFFREKYGRPKLQYPLFGDDGADRFDNLDLRTFQNYSWSFQGDNRGVFLRDQFSRDTQLAMGQQGERGDFYHLYLNGQYWGLFNTCERPEASYGATYFGGDKANYDVLKVEAGPYTVGATDGNLTAWTQLYNLLRTTPVTDDVYQRIQGRNPDGTPNPAYPNFIDVDNLIDYMLVIIYGGNLDAPISNFLGNTRPNNWYGLRDRTGSDGFRFVSHDAEHTLLNLNENRTGPYSAGDSSVVYSSPQWVYQKLWASPEFRLRHADRVHRHFFNQGALTPAAARERFLRRKAEIDRAVVGESARWGDAKRSTPFTRDDTWVPAINTVLNTIFPQRSTVVLSQLRAKNLYPNLAAPSFSQHGGAVNPGFALTLSAPAGILYYTLDGSDPRQLGGAVNPAARTYAATLTLNESTQVRARVRQDDTWSALNEAEFTLIQTYTDLVLTEIMYHPAPTPETDGDEFEFLELKNIAQTELDLSGVRFTNGVRFAFPNGRRLGPGQFAVLVRNPAAFAQRYPGVRIDGTYTGALANGGETLELVHAVGTALFKVAYADLPPWPETADGQGFSLVPVNPNFNPAPAHAASWRASSAPGGSPGRDDPSLHLPAVVVNELLTHTDPPMLDTVELFNPTTQPADLSGWYLTDQRSVPKKFRLPAGTLIPAGGYALFDESQFNPQPGVDPSFTLSSHGEQLYLFSADAAGNLTGYSDGLSFEASANGVSFGRHTNSVGDVSFPAQRLNTLGGPNAGPRVGPVVLNEIHYHPPPGGLEFVELKNTSAAAVALYDPAYPTHRWKLAGTGFEFPPDTTIAPGSLVVVTGSDPAAFRARYGLAATVPVFGPWPGSLQDNGELLQLQRPDSPDVDTNGVVFVPYVTVDAVRYHDQAPWPTNAAGLGSSLERARPKQYGNDPASWRASFGPPSPGLDNDANRRPLVSAGIDQALEVARVPATVTLAGQATDDGLPDPPAGLAYTWSQVSGAGLVTFNDPHALATAAHLPGLGLYVLRLEVSDGALEAAAEVRVTLSRPPLEATLVAAGSEWKYWDKGSEPTGWKEPGFSDSGWSAGKAQLGYGDGDEITTVGFGPDSNNKYTTTYFRRTFPVAGAAGVTGLTVKILRDDGPVVYLNGIEVLRDNLPEGEVNYATWAGTAIGGADESTFIEKAVDPALLREGPNLLAVEMHQANAGSSDLSFDLELSALTSGANLPPTAQAGPDLAAVVDTPLRIQGTATDDGLPVPPGVLSVLWTLVSGPGTVGFAPPNAPVTDATFSAPGTYQLRFTAHDGALTATDDLQVEVRAPFRLETLSFDAQTGLLRVRVRGTAGQRLALQYRDTLTAGAWQNLQQADVAPGGELLEFSDLLATERPSRFYRVAVLP